MGKLCIICDAPATKVGKDNYMYCDWHSEEAEIVDIYEPVEEVEG